MKKFAFLLAIVAVFAMSASAFAAADKKVKELLVGFDDSSTVLNHGAFMRDSSNYSTTAYYFGDDIPTLTIGVKYELEGALSDVNNKALGGFIGDPVAVWTPITATLTTTDTKFDGILEVKQAATITGLGVYSTVGIPTKDTAALCQLQIVVKKVTGPAEAGRAVKVEYDQNVEFDAEFTGDSITVVDSNVKVYLDNSATAAESAQAEFASKKVTLKGDYVKTLSAGKHTITLKGQLKVGGAVVAGTGENETLATFNLLVVDPSAVVTVAPAIGVVGRSEAAAAVAIKDKFSFEGDISAAAAPAGVVTIKDDKVTYDPGKKQFTISAADSTTFAKGSTAITVKGKLKYDGEDVLGAEATDKLTTFTFKVNDYEVTPASAAWDGNAEPPSGVKFTIKDLTADKISKIEITGSGVGSDVLDPANYTATTNGSDVDVELKLEYLEGLSKNDYTFTITGESNKTAEFALSVTPKAEASYAAEPSSATWDGSTAAGVKFKVNMPSGNFNAIGVKMPDADAEDVRELGKDYYTVTPTADGIEIELKPEYLSSLTEAGDYVYSVGDMKGLAALFTLTVTNVNGEVPSVGAALPSGESAPEGVQFGISQRRMRSDEITELDERIGGFLDDDGKIRKDKAAELVNADEDALTVLPIIGTTLDEGKTIAAFTYGVTGSELVSEKVDGIRWYDAIIHKMYVGSLAPASVRLRPVLTWGAIANGTYMILDDNGRLLADDYVVEPDGTRYKLVVYVEDDSDYDLDKDPQSVADPVAIQTSSGGSSKSSSGCDAGASLAVLAGLAAIAILRRGK